jgi:imidazolonepropionase-like amidohydrolase
MQGNSIVGAALVAALLSTSAVAGEITIIKAGSLFDSSNGKVSKNAVIVVEDDKIIAVGDSRTQIPDGAEVIDLSSSFVLPGVMDMHTHVVGNLDNYFFAGYFQSPHRATIGGVVNAEKTLMAGFTTIRNVGAPDYADVALRNAINAGEVPSALPAVIATTMP